MQKIYVLILIAALTGLMSCKKQSSDNDLTVTLSYANPVWDGYFADPHVIFTNGYYYAYGTGGTEDGKHFPILKTTFLKRK